MLLKENYITRGFWGDEAWTALISRLSVPEILKITGQDFHPPLYYLIVHFFMQIFGDSEWIRAISTFFFVLTLFPTYKLAKKVTGSVLVAKAATMLVAVSPILFTYAFEARAYALLTFLSVYSSLLFWKAVQGNSKGKKPAAVKDWALYALVGGLGVYTHYYMWFILASHGLYWLVMNRKQFKQVFLSYLAIVAVQLPWLPILFSQLKTVKGDYWIGQINDRTHWEFFMRIVAGDYATPWQEVVGRVMLAALLISVPLVLRNKKNIQGYAFLWFWLVIPVLFPTIISFIYRPVFFYRYMVFSSVPILMIIAWGLAVINKKALLLGGTALALVSLSTDFMIFKRTTYGFREELLKVFAAPIPPSQDVKIYTYLGSFAEVYYYIDQRVPVVVSPVGLVQFSGQSLLDAYQVKGLVTVEEPQAGESYWELGPEKTSVFHSGK
jgi:mannosyltransferase